jgi:hypothetical protein
MVFVHGCGLIRVWFLSLSESYRLDSACGRARVLKTLKDRAFAPSEGRTWARSQALRMFRTALPLGPAETRGEPIVQMIAAFTSRLRSENNQNLLKQKIIWAGWNTKVTIHTADNISTRVSCPRLLKVA